MIEYLPSVISSLKAAKDIITTIQGLRDFDKITTATIELKERLIETIDNVLASKEQFLSFQTEISDLKKECARLKDWSAEKEQYMRKMISDGVFAYVINKPESNFENAHKLCCNCFDKTIKSTLQQQHKRENGWHYVLICPNGCPSLKFRSYIDQRQQHN